MQTPKTKRRRTETSDPEPNEEVQRPIELKSTQER
jgi:hypothetical protein